MSRISLALSAILFLGFFGTCAIADRTTPGQAETTRVVAAANGFIATLDKTQQSKLLYPFSDDEQRKRWSNFPTESVARGGLRLRDLSPAQQAAAMTLMATVLSRRGFKKVQQIMEADEVFKTMAHPASDTGVFGKDLYYISLLGTPSETAPWMLQFGGHHLALNITIAGEHGVLTPSLTGAQPTSYTVDGNTVRPLGQENDKGFALLDSLNDGQRKLALLNDATRDLVLGPGHDGETIQPEGLKVAFMNDKQKGILLDLIYEWVGIINQDYAAERMTEIKAGLDDSWFAWSGPTTVEPGKNGTAYFRIQGPKLVIEFAPQPGDDHVHTIYRDPTNDYGKALFPTSASK